jgi:hypothetical protein
MYIHFCDFCDPQKKPLNESCVEKVVKAYHKEGIDLEKKGKLLFFFAFNWRSINYPDELGALVAKNSSEHGSFQKEYENEVKKIKGFSLFEYVIYLSGKLGEEDSEISKILTLSHECKHLIQDLDVEDGYIKDMVLRKYLRLRCPDWNQVYRNMPSEYDAFRESKRIAFKICGKEKVEKFLDDKINEHKNRLIYTRCDSTGLSDEVARLTYWEHIKAINIHECFDFKEEFNKIWNIYGRIVRTEIGEINKKCEEELSGSEEELIQAYNFLMSKSLTEK